MSSNNLQLPKVGDLIFSRTKNKEMAIANFDNKIYTKRKIPTQNRAKVQEQNRILLAGIQVPHIRNSEIFLKDTVAAKSYVDFRHSPSHDGDGTHRDFRDRDKASSLNDKIALPKFGNTRYKINKLKKDPILNRK